jgi:hypothetical protein
MTKQSRAPTVRKNPKERVVEIQNKLLKLWLDLRIEDPDTANALKASADALDPVVAQK